MTLRSHLDKLMKLDATTAKDKSAWDWLYALELKQTSTEAIALHAALESQLDKNISSIDTALIQEFLANRWKRIRHTDLSYTHSSQNKISEACLALANAIAPATGKHAHELLMPTITSVIDSAAASSLNDLSLKQYILSDDDKLYIEILATLRFAEEDGILKKYDDTKQKTRELTKNEKQRLLAHSEEVKSYYAIIKKIISYKKDRNSIGAFLQGLADQLRRGGLDGGHGGTEEEASDQASIGIANFRKFLDILTDQERDELFATSASHNTEETFADTFDKMINPLRKSKTNQLFLSHCAKTLASDIESILQSNKNLFDITPVNLTSTQLPNENIDLSIQELENIRQNARERLEKILGKKTSTVKSTYGIKGITRLIDQLAAHPDSLKAALTTDDKNIFNDAESFIDALKKLPKKSQSKLLSLVPDQQLQKMKPNKYELANLLNLLSVEDSNKLIEALGNAYFLKTLSGTYEFKTVLSNVADWQKLSALFKLEFATDLIKKILQNELSTLPSGSQYKFLELVGFQKAITLVETPEQLKCMLSHASAQQKKELENTTIPGQLHHIFFAYCHKAKEKSELKAAIKDAIADIDLFQGTPEIYPALVRETISVYATKRKEKSFMGIFGSKTSAVIALKNIADNGQDLVIVNKHHKQLSRDNEVGELFRRVISC